MNFDDQFQHYKERAEAAILRFLPPADEPPAQLHGAMHYCMEAGGKRLRPVLLLACADCYPSAAAPDAAAAAIEMLHTYTLIHDDLPCMDDSPLRRGRPSAHVAFDEATAVLAGDALLTESFGLLSRTYAAEPAVGMQLVRTLAQAADSRHLIGGQVVDTLSESAAIDSATLDFIHQHKTADLIAAACMMGVHTTRHPQMALETISAMGRHLGMAFQIVDDLLDATSDEATMGKTVGNDARLQKNTYVSLHGLEDSRTAAAHHTQSAIRLASTLPSPVSGFLCELICQLEFRIT